MAELLTAAQMRAVEQDAITSGAVSGLELMERAGRGVVDAVFDHWPELSASSFRAAVLCGPGNNGGDGFVIARLLRDWGWHVDLFLLGDPDRLPADAKTNCARWQALGPVHPLQAFPADDTGYDLYVDAMFGTGLVRPVEGQARAVLSGLAASPHHQQRLVCVDIPSGLCADSGRVLGAWDMPAAALTVTFHTAKPGHLLAQGPGHCGPLSIADIGLPADWRRSRGLSWGQVAQQVVRPDSFGPAHLAVPRFAAPPNKYSHGHAVVLSGGMGRSGAARLAARGALRVGAGLVTVMAPGPAMMECACQLTAIMLRKGDSVADLGQLLIDKRLNALCLGPGLGLDRARDLVPAALAAGRALVLDADGLTAFADAPEQLFKQLHPACVLTPHAGEFARLFPDLAENLTGVADSGPAVSKLDATRAAAVRAGCTVLFKGADTVIASETGHAAIHSAAHGRDAPWLATAGSGDVLAGLITGLLARGLAPAEAAETATWLHVEAGRRFGPGLIAEDLPDQIPSILRDLLG